MTPWREIAQGILWLGGFQDAYRTGALFPLWFGVLSLAFGCASLLIGQSFDGTMYAQIGAFAVFGAGTLAAMRWAGRG